MNLEISRENLIMIKSWIFFLLCMLPLPKQAFASALFIDSPQLHGDLIGKSLQIYEDPTNDLTFGDILKLPDSAYFEVPKLVPGFGASRSTYWARIELFNRLDSDIKIFLEYSYPLADIIEFHYKDSSGNWTRTTEGDRQIIPSNEHRLPTASMIVPKHESQLAYIKVYNQGFTQLPIRIWSEAEFQKNRAWELSLVTSLLAIIAMMLVYNTFLYLTTRERILGIYIAFLALNFVCQLAPTGMLRMLENTGMRSFLSNSGYIFSTNILFLFLFHICVKFLEINGRQKSFRVFAYPCIASGLVGAISVFFNYGFAAKLASLNSYLFMTALLVLTIGSVWKGNKSAKFLLFAWAGMIVCIIMQQLYWLAIVTNQYFAFGGLIGSATEVVLISLAIGHKMRNQIQLALDENERINAEILEKERARTVFFHNTSHELRTPLNGMIGFLHLILKGHYGQVNEAASSQLAKTLRLAESLKQQVNTILDLARLKKGDVNLRNSLFSLNELKSNLDDLCDGLLLKHQNSSYQSELLLDDASGQFCQDYDKVFAICRNLVGNAFKFSHSHQKNDIKLVMRQLNRSLLITVRDTGLGIPKDQMQRIFDEFVQVESDARRSHEGTGLGLSMVRDFVQLMGGTIEVASELGQGSTFTVKLPEQNPTMLTSSKESAGFESEFVKNASTIEFNRPSMPQPSSEFDDMSSMASILVVDDNEVNCEVIQELLTYRGYRSKTALSGRQALELLQKQSFDLILLDIMMPEMSGEDVILNLRRDPALKEIPVILITARASEEDRIHGLNLGADDYISKPIIADELLLRVANLLRRIEDTRRQSQEESQEKMRQLGELFTYTSHEIKNIYSNIGEGARLLPSEIHSLLAQLSIPETERQSLIQAFTADKYHSSLQEGLDALPKTPKQQNLRTLRVGLASLLMPIDHLVAIWQKAMALPDAEQEYLNVVLKWHISYKLLNQAMTRSRDIFHATLAFVRIDTAEHCQLWDALDPIIVLLAVRAQKENIHLDANIPRIMLNAQPNAVQQIILNLLTNAMDAVRELPPGERTVKIWVSHEPASPRVQIKVSNRGLPILGDIKSQLFKRGFTTKGSKGNGFGLYLSRKLAQKNQGELFLDETSQEACFVLELNIGDIQRGPSNLYRKAS